MNPAEEWAAKVDRAANDPSRIERRRRLLQEQRDDDLAATLEAAKPAGCPIHFLDPETGAPTAWGVIFPAAILNAGYRKETA